MLTNNDGSPSPNVRTGNGRQDGAHPQTNNNEDVSRSLDSWLPITASRKAKWWYSAFHNVTAMVGAGVLGLPLVLARLGWYPGVLAILISWLLTWYTLWLLVQLHESAEPGKRFDRFNELGQHAFGERLGNWAIIPQQLVVQVGSNIVYMVTGGKSLQKCFVFLESHSANIRKTYYILFFAVLQLILSQVPNFNSLKFISLLAAVMSIGYSMVATGASSAVGISNHLHNRPVNYGFKAQTTAAMVMDIFSSLGLLAFAFAGHSVALEIQATIPSTPENPSKNPMWKGVVVAYIIVGLCYFPVAISGYLAFGSDVEDDVLMSLEHPGWLISLANFMVFVHVLGSYQVFAMPVFDKIECLLVKTFHYTPGRRLRVVARSIYVALTGFVGMLLPFFGGLLGFFGGLAFTITSYIIPSVIWLTLKRPKPWSFHWTVCWFSIVLGTGVTCVAPIGGIHEIVMQWKSFTIFS
ncbi:lysine histidine transporter-like 5 [Andrographis paniculata]|uniref:lysine histidine transporter-like 5 n=1 Tax=Andrographis paniculata TaxID=175694 RepID=UPI0021E6FA55|nr:lysine histidine transporter-like 5 [Andrographis paniculata]